MAKTNPAMNMSGNWISKIESPTKTTNNACEESLCANSVIAIGTMANQVHGKGSVTHNSEVLANNSPNDLADRVEPCFTTKGVMKNKRAVKRAISAENWLLMKK